MVCGWLGRVLSGSPRGPRAAAVAQPSEAGRAAPAYRRPDAVVQLGRQAIALLSAALLLWAVASGTWRAIETAVTDETLAAVTGSRTVMVVVGALFYAAGAFGAALLILIAAAMIGGAFGFLFGLPRMEGRGAPIQVNTTTQTGANPVSVTAPVQGEAAPAQAPPHSPAGALATEQTSFRMSPALNEIADWLTKIIVGLGLVQARAIAEGFRSVMGWLLFDAGLERFPAAAVVVPACMLIGVIGGFVLVYLAMTLVMGPELADAAYDLDTPRVRQERAAREQAVAKAQEERERRQAAEAESRRIEEAARERARVVDQWRKFDILPLLAAEPGAAMPTVSDADRQFAALNFAECATLDEKLAWAKINAALGQKDRAVDAYEAAMQEGAA